MASTRARNASSSSDDVNSPLLRSWIRSAPVRCVRGSGTVAVAVAVVVVVVGSSMQTVTMPLELSTTKVAWYGVMKRGSQIVKHTHTHATARADTHARAHTHTHARTHTRTHEKETKEEHWHACGMMPHQTLRAVPSSSSTVTEGRRVGAARWWLCCGLCSVACSASVEPCSCSSASITAATESLRFNADR